MPITSLAMAQPATSSYLESMLPEEEHVLDNRGVSRKYLYTKGCEMILIIVTITLFAFAVRGKQGCTEADVFIAYFFGGLTLYPILVLVLLPMRSYHGTEMLLLNAISSAVLFVSGFILFASWHELQPTVLAQQPGYASAETLALFRFTAALASITTAILYLAEAFFQILEKFGCIGA